MTSKLTSRHAAHIVSEAKRRSANLPELLEVFPEVGFKAANHYSIADRPCPSCNSTLVSKRDELGHDRPTYLVEPSSSSLRILQDEPADLDEPGVTYSKFTIACLAGGCSYSMGVGAFLGLARSALGDEEFVSRCKTVRGMEKGKLEEWWFADVVRGNEHRVRWSKGSEIAAVAQAANGAAGIKIHVQMVEAFSYDDAERALTLDGWTTHTLDADGCLPLGFHGGPLKKHEQRRADLFDLEEEAKKEAELRAKVREFETELRRNHR